MDRGSPPIDPFSGRQCTETQLALRKSIFYFIRDNPGASHGEIHSAHDTYLSCQITTAINWLRRNEYTYIKGHSQYSKWYLTEGIMSRNFLTEDPVEVSNDHIPDRPLFHAEYWLFILSYATNKENIPIPKPRVRYDQKQSDKNTLL